MFAQSSYAKSKSGTLNLTLNENFIAGHSPSLLHREVVSKWKVTFSSEHFPNKWILALVSPSVTWRFL